MTVSGAPISPSKKSSTARLLAKAAAIILVIGLVLVTFLPGSGAAFALRITVFVPGILAIVAIVMSLGDFGTGFGKRTMLIAAVVLAICLYLLGYGTLGAVETTLPS